MKVQKLILLSSCRPCSTNWRLKNKKETEQSGIFQNVRIIQRIAKFRELLLFV